MIYVNNGKNDYRVYPKPGSLLNIELEIDNLNKESSAEKKSANK